MLEIFVEIITQFREYDIHNEFYNPLLYGIAKNTWGEILLCKSQGYDKFDKMSLNDLTSCGHTAKSTIEVLRNR